MMESHNNRTVLAVVVRVAARYTETLNQHLFKILALITLMLLSLPSISLAEVEGHCMMCHQYPGLGRIEKTDSDKGQGRKRLFYINNTLFESSYHGKTRCKRCHTGVDKLPHTDAPAVDCATDCHIMDPSNNKPFSHRKIVDDYKYSAHGKLGSQAADKSGLPVCKDCHSNKTYHAYIEEQLDSTNKIKVCRECHESSEFVQSSYEHIAYRMSKRRPSRDIVMLCSTCHADKELMKQANLDVVDGFASTFHAKAIQFGNEDVADCLSCHAPYALGFSPHRITSSRELKSPVSVENKIETCRQSGCHAGAKDAFAIGSRVHPSPEKIKYVAASGRDRQAETNLLDDPTFQTRVIGWIELFYKVLIVAVIGGLGLHRLLDMYAHRREQREKREKERGMQT